MGQAILFLIIAVALYYLSDQILLRIEVRAGRRLEHRTLIFFFILLGLGLAVFGLLEYFLAS